MAAETLKIVKIWFNENNGAKYIAVMLNNAECVYFHKFGETIYTEVPEGIQKKTFTEFKNDIVKFEWNVEKLILNWVK